MSALLRAIARRIRLLLHRHDQIECWCELPEAPAQVLPVHQGPGSCRECFVAPGETHELSCPEVSFEQMQAYLDRVGGAR